MTVKKNGKPKKVQVEVSTKQKEDILKETNDILGYQKYPPSLRDVVPGDWALLYNDKGEVSGVTNDCFRQVDLMITGDIESKREMEVIATLIKNLLNGVYHV